MNLGTHLKNEKLIKYNKDRIFNIIALFQGTKNPNRQQIKTGLLRMMSKKKTATNNIFSLPRD